MKTHILIPLLFISTVVVAQKEITVCHGGAPQEFAMLASNRSFAEAHLLPGSYVHTSKVGKDITFKAADGSDAHGYLLRAKKYSKKYLFVFHEWYGLNDYVKKEAEKLYNDLGNVNVLAIDLYDKKVAQNREEAGQLMQDMKTARGEAIIKGALQYAGKDAEIATLGWCFGGAWSLQAALLLKERADGCVIYYGMPEKDVERLKALECSVLGIFASRDQWINPAVVEEFAKNMEAAGNDLEYKIFDAVHAFANPSNADYDSEAAREAYEMTLRFLKKKL